MLGLSGEFWELVRPEDYEKIAGEYEYTVNVGSTMPRLPQIERAQFLSALQVLAQFPHLLTSKRMVGKILEWHHIEDETLLEELMKIGQQIMGGQVPAPGQSGSAAGVAQDNPITKILGAALGDQGGVVNQGSDQAA